MATLSARPSIFAPGHPDLTGYVDMGCPESPAFDRDYLERLLLWATDHDVSDITIQAGNFVFVEQFGRLFPVTRRRWTGSECFQVAQAIYGDNAPSQLARGLDIDCSHEIRRGRRDLARYRVNMVSARAPGERGVEITFRTLPTTPPSLDDLQVRPALRDHLVFEHGLVLITGPTGSGKTTLLGAVIRSLLEAPDSHRKIITYEAPIEFVYDEIHRSHALVAQHEIGVHLPSFAAGVRNSLRRKPSVILVGEARDAETIDAMTLAAHTGHLVYTTSHANSVPETLRRLIEPFPAPDRESRWAAVLGVLRGVVTQRLVQTTDGRRAPVREYLLFTDAIKDALLAAPFLQAATLTRAFVRQYGRPLMADVRELRDAGRISPHEFARFRDVDVPLDPPDPGRVDVAGMTGDPLSLKRRHP